MCFLMFKLITKAVFLLGFFFWCFVSVFVFSSCGQANFCALTIKVVYVIFVSDSFSHMPAEHNS